LAKKVARKRERDIEIGYSTRAFVEKLRRLADALEQGGPFAIQIANERVHVPAGAVFNIEHEREGGNEEIELQLKWSQVRESTSRAKNAAKPPRGRGRRSKSRK
jgi:amphi-Trp domain-containing protein